jgi:hypothetical protein
LSILRGILLVFQACGPEVFWRAHRVFPQPLGPECRSQLTDYLNGCRSQENDEEAGEDEEDQRQQQFHRQLGGHLRGLEILPRA